MRALALGLVAALVVLHHDFWFWDDPTLVAGVMPVGLAWHVGFSVAGSGVWWLVTRYAWPGDPAAHRDAAAPDAAAEVSS